MTKSLERFISMTMLLFLSGAILPMLVSEEYPVDVNAMSDSRLLVIQLFLYSMFVAILVVHAWANKPFVAPPLWLGMLIFWTVCSVAWASEPLHAAKRLSWDLASMLFGLYLGANYNNREEADLLFKALAFCAVLSILVAVVDPGWAYMRGGALTGNLRGVFSQKNVLGKNMALLGMVCLYRLRSGERGRGRTVLVLFLSLGLLYMSKSTTSVILVILAFALLPLLRVFRLPPFQLILGGAAVSLLLGVTIMVLIPRTSELLESFGKKADLTGRTELWSQVIAAIARHPWHGYGVYSFWNGMYGPSAAVIAAIGWDAPHAHNGFLDVLLDVGAIGLALFLFAYASAVIGAIRNYRNGESETELWPLLFLVMTLFANLTESSLIHQSIYWTLFLSSAYRASKPIGAQSALSTLPLSPRRKLSAAISVSREASA
jgi:O-antigen ligase